MRIKALPFLFAAVGFLLTAGQGVSQDAIYLRYTNSWRYFQAADQGTNWRTAAFDDSSWPQGLGLFALEDPAVYPVPINTTMQAPAANNITTYYRTRFNFSGSTTGVRFNITNYVDDGMIAYLNGVELFRFNMPAGAVTATTLATAAPAEPSSFITNILATGLISGQNVMAVEVHQSAATSSDVVFGMSIGTYGPPSITSQPQSQTNVAGSQTIMCVGASGAGLTYQWQKDNGGSWANVSGANSSCYTNATPITAAGNYRAIVSNPTASVTSQVATLTVLIDNVGPLMTAAVVSEVLNTNQIVITFNEKLTGSSVLTNSFQVWTRSGGATNLVNIESAFYNSGTIGAPESSAVLRVGGANWNIGSDAYNGTVNYYIIANNIRDVSGNVIAPNSVIGVSFPNTLITNVLRYNSVWNYHPDWAFDPTIYQQPWYSNSYNPSLNFSWAYIQGLVRFDLNPPGSYCVPTATAGPDTASYQDTPTLFRYEFFWPANLSSNVSLRLGYLYDDGFVAYLNGREILRQNVNGTGPVDEATKSTAEVGVPACGSNVIANVTLLSGRTNLIAVAVVQPPGGLGTVNDLTFGMFLNVEQTSLVTAPKPTSSTNAAALRLFASKIAPNQMRLSWWTNVEPTHANNLYGYTVTYATNINRVGTSNILGPVSQMQPGITNGMVTNFTANRVPYYIRLQRVP